MTRWLSDKPLLLASKSLARQSLLQSSGIVFEVCPAHLDERALENNAAFSSHAELALILARAKAQAVWQNFPNRCVLAADQLLVMDEKRFHQCVDYNEAIEHLQKLSGKTHTLISAAVLIDANNQSHEWLEKAEMSMRVLLLSDIEAYLDMEGPDVLKSVGCYHYESHGKILFSQAAGTLPCILGMPMHGLEQYLINKGYLEA